MQFSLYDSWKCKKKNRYDWISIGSYKNECLWICDRYTAELEGTWCCGRFTGNFPLERIVQSLPVQVVFHKPAAMYLLLWSVAFKGSIYWWNGLLLPVRSIKTIQSFSFQYSIFWSPCPFLFYNITQLTTI